MSSTADNMSCHSTSKYYSRSQLMITTGKAYVSNTASFLTIPTTWM